MKRTLQSGLNGFGSFTERTGSRSTLEQFGLNSGYGYSKRQHSVLNVSKVNVGDRVVAHANAVATGGDSVVDAFEVFPVVRRQ